MLRYVVDPVDPAPAAIEKAAASIREGGVVAFPTDTLYGLAVDPFSPQAVQRVLALKNRPAERALPLIAADMTQVTGQIGELPTLARKLAERFWPGPLTLLVPAPEALRATVTAGSDKVGIRIPDHAVARALCRASGRPLTATSANISGEPATDDPDAVAASLGGLVDLLLDGGRTTGGAPSTLVDATESVPRLLRPGAIPWDQIHACAVR
jgi:L-threonylcarbamoyladenylate synthase